MSHEQKFDYVLDTTALALVYYGEEPISWMASEKFELDRTMEHFVQTTDVSAASRVNDATFGRLIRIAIFDTVKQIRKAIRDRKVAAATLTGKEWLSWPLERKQALVADYLSFAFRMGINKKKIFRPDELSLEYIKGIDETAQKHSDDPRLNKFIGNFIGQMLKRAIEQANRNQVTKG